MSGVVRLLLWLLRMVLVTAAAAAVWISATDTTGVMLALAAWFALAALVLPGDATP
jgi:hypothetical protein